MSSSRNKNIAHRARLGEKPIPKAQGKCTATGKVRWDSRRGAREHMLRLRAIGAPDAAVLNVYRCPECLTWHVGHKPPGAAHQTW